jgi:hypothetical protein
MTIWITGKEISSHSYSPIWNNGVTKVIIMDVIRTLKGNGKVVPVLLFFTEHHAMKTYWGSGGIAPRILWPRHYMEVGDQLQAPAVYPQGKDSLVPRG